MSSVSAHSRHFERQRTCEKWKKANGFSNEMRLIEPGYVGCIVEPLFPESHCAFLFAAPQRPNLILCARFSGRKEGASRCAIVVSWLDIAQSPARWSEPVVAAVQDDKSFQNPVLFAVPDEPQRLYLIHTSQDAGRLGVSQQSSALMIVHSDDFGATWSAARTLLAVGRGAFTRGPVLNLVGAASPAALPVYYTPDGTFERDRQYAALAHLVRGADNGELVFADEVSIPGTLGANGVQPVVLRSRVNPERLLVFLRSRTLPHVQFSQSDDGGASFEPIRPTIFPNNNSGIAAVFVGKFLLLAFNNCTGRRRFPLTLAISEDEGQTWLRVRDVVDEERCGGNQPMQSTRGEHSYPTLLSVDDTKFMLAWTHRRESIAVGMFDLDWLLLGGDGRSCSSECAQFSRKARH
jgi:predicted neuraminidase